MAPTLSVRRGTAAVAGGHPAAQIQDPASHLQPLWPRPADNPIAPQLLQPQSPTKKHFAPTHISTQCKKAALLRLSAASASVCASRLLPNGHCWRGCLMPPYGVNTRAAGGAGRHSPANNGLPTAHAKRSPSRKPKPAPNARKAVGSHRQRVPLSRYGVRPPNVQSLQPAGGGCFSAD